MKQQIIYLVSVEACVVHRIGRKVIRSLFGNKVKARPGDNELTSFWRAFLTKFEGVSEKQADCIIAVYPTFQSLYSAFKSSHNPQTLLQDIRIGKHASAKRFGPKMSKRLYKYLFEFRDAHDVFV
eukprot:TRINITY_DN2530_c0_g1_i1.p1 TRINITY_DN2530_c0_g1~~TRINITY_DN2530_c0_g1_i1.p1  ORF type:complete len:125 (-),score=13.00 TRINITY_DN2530_c0_g1_i1:100-474(-)